MGLLANFVNPQTAVCLPPTATAQEAAEKMKEHKIGCLIVQQNSDIIGIFTERDLLNRVIAVKKDVTATPLSEVMSEQVATISINSTVFDCYQTMERVKCRHIPIVDGDKVVSMVSMRNILEWLVKEIEEENLQMKTYIRS